MQLRRTTGEEAKSLLEKQMSDDSLPEDGRAHVIGIARLIGAPPEELYEAVGGSDAQGWQKLLDSVMLAEARQLGLPDAVSYTGDGKLLGPRWSFLDSSLTARFLLVRIGTSFGRTKATGLTKCRFWTMVSVPTLPTRPATGSRESSIFTLGRLSAPVWT